MKIEEALVAYLTDDAELTELVNKRIYSYHAPANVVMPFITYQRISTARFLTHDQTASGLSAPRFQFDVICEGYAEGLDIVEALREALQGYRGVMGEVSVGGILPEGEQHIDVPEYDYHRLTVDYKVMYQEEKT